MMKEEAEERREQLERITDPKFKESMERGLEEQDWILDEDDHRVRKMKFDHYRGLGALPDCKLNALNTFFTML